MESVFLYLESVFIFKKRWALYGTVHRSKYSKHNMHTERIDYKHTDAVFGRLLKHFFSRSTSVQHQRHLRRCAIQIDVLLTTYSPCL